jgi:hypothetical protein
VTVSRETNVTVKGYIPGPVIVNSNSNIESNVTIKGEDVSSSSLSKRDSNKTNTGYNTQKVKI